MNTSPNGSKGDAMNHIEMMRLAEQNAKHSDCTERNVGAVALLANGDAISSCNSAAWDRTNGNHAESKIVVMAELGGHSLRGAALYTTCRPCVRCTEMLLPLGLKAIYYRDEQPEMGHLQRLRDAGVLVDGGWIQGQIQQSWAERSGQSGVVA